MVVFLNDSLGLTFSISIFWDARTRLVEAIARPISSESRGFKLLSMMGYKPGMSIGVSRDGGTDGIKEPISIDLISGRHGIGHGKRSHASTTSTGAAVRPDTVFILR